mgnify:CR=1 FL=1
MTPGRERYALFVLMLIYAFGYLDRQVVNILAEPIKNELQLSDSELGLLTGLAFALFYTLLGLPVARLADRFDRSRIISASLFVWSSCTALSGLASSYASLLLLRIGVGVGEAGCNPPATSLIADVVPRHRRASAMSVFALRVDGSLCLVGALTRQPIAFPAPHMIYGNLHVSGITVGSRQQQLDMVKAVETGGLRPVIDSVHSFHDLPEAFGALQEQRHFGKIAIEYD